jgi:hypothetical protein
LSDVYHTGRVITIAVRKIGGWLLIVHGIVCLLGAFFPLYPPIFLFFWFSPGPFAMKLIIVLVAGAAQVVLGVYLAFIEKLKQIRWYWLVLIAIVIVLLLLVYPALNYFFGL